MGIDVAAHVAEDLGKAFGERLVKASCTYQQVKKVLEKYQWFIIYSHTVVQLQMINFLMTFLINIEFSFPIWLKQDMYSSFAKGNLFATWILIPGLCYKYLSFLCFLWFIDLVVVILES